MKQTANELPSPFERQLQSTCPTSVRFYKKFLEKKITQQKLEAKVNTLLTIAQQRTLTQEENESLNKLDNQITKIMINAEKKINCKQTSPWSPELHIAIRTVTLWKLTLTQLKTKISQHKNITSIQNKLTLTINLDWKTPHDIFHHLKMAKNQLIHIRKESTQLRTNYLLQRASAMDLASNKTARNIIININKIEQIIKMWKVIQFTTSTTSNSSIQTIDVPTDTSIPWNNIKRKKNVVFKTIDNPRLIEELVADRNSHHLNQAQGSPFTVEPLQSLLGPDSDTPFAEALLNSNEHFSNIPLTNVTKRYLESMTINTEIFHSSKQQTIPFDDYKKGFLNWKEKTTTSPPRTSPRTSPFFINT